jgi:hypothetical protein
VPQFQTGRFLRWLAFGLSVYGLTLAGLIWAWYGVEGQTSFHWFDDSGEWLGMDKLGHCTATFQVAAFALFILQKAGAARRPASWIAALMGWLVVSSYELLDGLSPTYGASWADLLANAGGALLLPLQVRVFPRLMAIPKLSYYSHALAPLRPALLGSTMADRWLKDYNGMTLWLSLDVNTITNRKLLPPWMTVAVGYGAEGLLGGHDNVWTDAGGTVHDYSQLARTQQFYLSLDLNVIYLRERLPERWRWLLMPLHLIKCPAPAIEWGAEGLRWHWVKI